MSDIGADIRAGTAQMAGAYQALAKARREKKDRRLARIETIGEAVAGLGNEFKKYGSWRAAKQDEDEEKQITEGVLLAQSQRGDEGVLSYLTGYKPVRVHGARIAMKYKNEAEDALREQRKMDLDRVKEFRQSVSQELTNRELERYHNKELDLKTAREEREKAEVTHAEAQRKAVGEAYAPVEEEWRGVPYPAPPTRDPTPAEIEMRLGRSGQFAPKDIRGGPVALETMKGDTRRDVAETAAGTRIDIATADRDERKRQFDARLTQAKEVAETAQRHKAEELSWRKLIDQGRLNVDAAQTKLADARAQLVQAETNYRMLAREGMDENDLEMIAVLTALTGIRASIKAKEALLDEAAVIKGEEGGPKDPSEMGPGEMVKELEELLGK